MIKELWNRLYELCGNEEHWEEMDSLKSRLVKIDPSYNSHLLEYAKYVVRNRPSRPKTISAARPKQHSTIVKPEKPTEPRRVRTKPPLPPENPEIKKVEEFYNNYMTVQDALWRNTEWKEFKRRYSTSPQFRAHVKEILSANGFPTEIIN